MHPIVQRDERGVPRHVTMPIQPAAQQALSALAPRAQADDFLMKQGHLLDLPQSSLRSLRRRIASAPEAEASALRADGDKRVMDTHVIGYIQTFFGLPVIGAGVSVTVRDTPRSVLAASSTVVHGLQVEQPSAAQLAAATQRFLLPAGSGTTLGALGLPAPADGLDDAQRDVRVNASQLVVFRFESRLRQGEHPDGPGAPQDALPRLPLPPLAAAVADGSFRVAVELYFTASTARFGRLNWLMYVDVATLGVLQLVALVDHAFASVFLRDPITKGTGVAPSAGSAQLNPLRDGVTLQGLLPPSGGTQSLRGEYVQIVDAVLPSIPPPVEPEPFAFGFDARTDDFAAANAYFQCDRFFRLVDALGFELAEYFDGTAFPVLADHRGFGANTINARCPGNTLGNGIGTLEFALADLTDTEHPLGIAADWRVVLHELGGHGILWDHVSRPNFGFAHSAGDSLAAILNDPGSSAPDRFLTFPWVDVGRRHDRAVAQGWGWGGTQDTGGYASEQIVSTTLFRLYRSLGGDSPALALREQAARTVAYLILRAVAQLTPGTNPTGPLGLEAALAAADGGVWTPRDASEPLAGGAYHKVIRWAFEKQGLYRAPGAPRTAEGAPPEVDVYIEGGEYGFEARYWTAAEIWNRHAADGGTTHQQPLPGQANHAYVRIQNRGSQPATGLSVRGFRAQPGIGRRYPEDYTELTPQPLTAADLAPGARTIVGPFAWLPQAPHEPLLFSVSAEEDASNLDGLLTGSIPDFRLVPHDNNLALRNVQLLPVSLSGSALARRELTIQNPFAHTVRLQLKAELPALLVSRGYQLQLTPASFELAARAAQQVTLGLKGGSPLTAADLPTDPDARSLTITAEADGLPIGGVTFVIDPDAAE